MAVPWGALLGLAGTALSGIMSAVNNKRQQDMADKEAARQQAALSAKANENPLSRSENQHLLGQYDRDAQRQVESARGVAAITGATPEYSLGVQKAVAEGRANLMGQMAAGASARKDKYDELAEQARRNKAYADMDRAAARQQSYANLAANAVSAAGSIIDAYGGTGGKKAPKAPDLSAPEIKQGNAAVADMNAKVATTGVKTSAAPTSIAKEVGKINTGLAAIKSGLEAQDAEKNKNYAQWLAEQKQKQMLPARSVI